MFFFSTSLLSWLSHKHKRESSFWNRDIHVQSMLCWFRVDLDSLNPYVQFFTLDVVQCNMTPHPLLFNPKYPDKTNLECLSKKLLRVSETVCAAMFGMFNTTAFDSISSPLLFFKPPLKTKTSFKKPTSSALHWAETDTKRSRFQMTS